MSLNFVVLHALNIWIFVKSVALLTAKALCPPLSRAATCVRTLAGILRDGAAEAEGVCLPITGTLVLHAGLDVHFQIKT